MIELSPRELRVLTLIADGYQELVIAAELNIAHGTARRMGYRLALVPADGGAR